MLKKQLVQLVKDGAGVQFSDRTVAIKIGMVFDTLAGQLFGANLNQFEFYSKQVPLTVSNRVAELDIPLIQTRLNGNGCPRIVPTGASCACMPDNTVMYPSPSFGLSIDVDAVAVPGFIFYTVTNSQIRFSRMLPAEVTDVTATVIPQFEYYGDDDIISLPTGIAQIIIDRSIESVKGNPAFANVFNPK